MPKNTYTITVSGTTEWESTEPDGSECFACGQQCFLSMHELVATISLDGVDQSKHRTQVFLCCSCFDATKLFRDELS